MVRGRANQLFTAEELSAVIQELEQGKVDTVSTDDGSAESAWPTSDSAGHSARNRDP